MTVRKMKNGSWLADFYIEKLDGTFKRHRKQPFASRKEAREYELKIMRLIDEEKENIRNGKTKMPVGVVDTSESVKVSGLKLSEFLTEIWFPEYKEKRENDYSPRNFDRIEALIKHQIIPVLGKVRLDKLETEHGEILKKKLVKKNKYTYRTINYALGTLKQALNWAVTTKPQLLQFNPIKTVSCLPGGFVGNLEKWDWMRPHERDLFLKIVSVDYPEWYPYFVVLLLTGIRASELCGLFWHDINFAEQKMTVCRKNDRGNYGSTKTGKSRTMPISKTVCNALLKHRQNSKMNRIITVQVRGNIHSGVPVFLNKDGNPHSNLPTTIKRPMKKALKQVGIERPFRVHDLRHSFASLLVYNNVSLEKVRQLLGHSKLETTLRYAHVADEKLQDAVELIEPNTNIAIPS